MSRTITSRVGLGTRAASALLAPLMGVTLALGGGTGPAAVAQDATPSTTGATSSSIDTTPRPAHIHDGSCGDDLGAVVMPLTDLTGGIGSSSGNSAATGAENSYTNVPLTIDQILAADHSINVHRSADQIDEYIACGEIGGAATASGSLVIGLRELNDSGFTGIAFLAPAPDGASTDVAVFVAEDLSGSDDDEASADSEDADADSEDADATATAEAEDRDADADETATAEADEDATATAEAEADSNGDDSSGDSDSNGDDSSSDDSSSDGSDNDDSSSDDSGNDEG